MEARKTPRFWMAVQPSIIRLYKAAGLVALTAILVGLLGFLAVRLRFEMAPMLLGFILGPLLEEHLRRSLLLSRGSLLIFLDRPISAALLAVALVLILGMANSTIRQRRAEVFADG